MPNFINLFLTMLAPMIWGSTYLVTSEWLPQGYPITVAMLRALPAGLLLLAFLRQWPKGRQLFQVIILGALNFTVFWICLFISAYRLPGGVAATLGAVQPLIVIGLTYALFNEDFTIRFFFPALAGIVGVALLVLKSTVALDGIGIFAALLGAASMAVGTVLSKKWRNDTPLLTFTGWQLTAGGLLLLPLSLFFEPNFPSLTLHNVFGLVWLGLVGALLSYILWFRGVARLGTVQISSFGFLSPLTAIVLGWLVLGQRLSLFQIAGAIIILISIITINKTGVKKHANARSH